MKLGTPVGKNQGSSSDPLKVRPYSVSESEAELGSRARTEKTMIRVRWVGVIFGVIQATTFYLPYPKGIFALAIGMVVLLAAGNIAIWSASRRVETTRQALQLSIASLGLDIAVILGLVFVYTFDPNTAIWALIYILPLEGAIRFGMRGALSSMTVAALLYSSREFYGEAFFGNELLPTSISFRMGIGFIVAAVAGSMARNLTKDRKHLQRANAMYESLLDSISRLGKGCLIVEGNRIIYSNTAIEEILGYEPGGLQKLGDFLDLLDENEAAKAMSLLAPGTHSREGGRFEAKGRKMDGSSIWVEVGYKPMDSDEVRIVVLIKDVTERILAETALSAKEEQLSEAQRIARIGSWRWDLLTDEVSWSDEMYRICGLRPQSIPITYDTFLDLVHDSDRDRVAAVVNESLKTGKPFVFDCKMTLPGGIERVLAGRGQAIFNEAGRTVAMVGTGQDITERKRTELLLIQALEREKAAVKRLQQMDEIKSDFLSTVSHELRTPVTTIGGFASTLLSKWNQLNDENREDFLRRIHSGANHLQRLISELLDFSMLERNHLQTVELSEYNLKAEITRLVEGMGPILESNSVITDIPDDLLVLCDPDALERVVENLFSNAIKFSPNHSAITVKARPRDRHEVIVEVHDEGLGIPPAEMQKVFDRFYRVNRGDSAPSGTGIGLAVVKRFVESQGGRVWVRARPGGGTIFSFSIKRPGLAITSKDTSTSSSSS